MFKLEVPGLKRLSIQHVLDHLELKGCLSFPFGGCVRDQFLEALPGDLDMETNCDRKYFNGICVARYGEENCESGIYLARAKVYQGPQKARRQLPPLPLC